MMDNEDLHGTSVLYLPRALMVHSEGHALRLANAHDLWDVGRFGRARSGKQARTIATWLSEISNEQLERHKEG